MDNGVVTLMTADFGTSSTLFLDMMQDGSFRVTKDETILYRTPDLIGSLAYFNGYRHPDRTVFLSAAATDFHGF